MTPPDPLLREKDLQMCWGIGPSKAQEGGFGFEMIDFFDSSPELLGYLEESRRTGLDLNDVIIT